SQRARDLIGGNNGAFFYGATNSSAGFVVGHTTNSLFFTGVPDQPANNLSTKIELGDPDNLRFTNSFSIEGWIRPIPQTNNTFTSEKIEQIFFRGDERACLDPYFFGLEQTGPDSFDMIFHIENENARDCGIILET